VIVVELWPDHRATSRADERQLLGELQDLGKKYSHTQAIRDLLIHPSLPVDIRHNAKIFREQLAVWAGKKLRA
jgi:hypothetical protein